MPPAPVPETSREPLLNQAEVIAAAKEVTAEKYPDAETVLVSEHVKNKYEADGSYVTLDDEYVKVLTEEGRRGAREKQLSYNVFYGGMEILAAEVIKPDGKVISHDPKKISKEQVDRSSMSANIYDPNDRLLVAAVPEVETGDVVRFFVKKWETRPRMKGHYSDWSVLESPSPIRHVVYEYNGPKDKPLRSKSLLSEIKGTVTAEEHVEGDRIRSVWTGRDIPQIFQEPAMPSFHTVGQRLLVSTLSDWKEVSRWYWDISKDHLTKITPEIQAKVSSLLAGTNTEEEKIKAIFKFVSQEIRYMGITTEKEAPGYEPHDVNITFENRYGVCRDKAALLASMLTEAGVPAYPVLVMAGEKLDQSAPSPFFNHAITAAKTKEGKFVLMDSTDENTADLLPQYLENKSYLVATPEGETLMTSEVTPAEKNMVLVKTDVNLADDGSATGKTVAEFNGINDNVYRGHLARMKPDDVRRLFERAVKGLLPGGTLTSVKLEPENMLDTAQKLRLSMEWSVPSLLVAGGGAAQLELPYAGSGFGIVTQIIGQGLQLEKRRFPLQTELACGVREDLEIKLPPSLEKPLALPQYENTEHKDFAIVQTISAETGVLKAATDIRLRSPEIAPEAYQELKQAMAKLQINGRQQPVFARKSSIAPPPPPTADVEVLSNHYSLTLDSATSWTSRQQVKQKVLTFAGKKSNSELKFDYNPAWETVEIESAQVTQKDGTVRKIQPQEMNTLDAGWVASAPRYPGAKTLVVSLPGVEVGSVIEYSVKQTAKDQLLFNSGYTFASNEIVDEIQISYDMPADLNPRLLMDFPKDGHLTDVTADGRRKMVFTWNDLKPRTREGSAPPAWVDSPDYVMSLNRWEDYAAMLGKRIAPMVENQPAAAAKAQELIAGKATPVEKITALRDFVARQIRREGPGYSELPLANAFSPADVTLKDGYGHGPDRFILLHTMLKAAGFETDLALAGSGTKEPLIQQRSLDFPDTGYFAGVVCRVKHPETEEWLPLDNLSQYAPLGSTSLDGQPGYTLDGKRFTWAAPANMDNRGDTEIALEFDAEGTALITVTRRMHGTAHENFVSQYSEMTPEERSRNFQGLVSGIAQNAKPEGDLITDFTYPGTQKFTVKVERFGVKNAGGLYFDLPGVPQQLVPTDAERRERALLFAGENESRTTWKVSAPAGLKPVIQPEPLDWRGPGSLGTAKFTAETGAATDRTRLSYSLDLDLHPALIPTGNYSELLDLNRRFNHPAARRVLLQPAAQVVEK